LIHGRLQTANGVFLREKFRISAELFRDFHGFFEVGSRPERLDEQIGLKSLLGAHDN